MLVEPGFFRTELLTTDSTTYAHPTIADYAAQTKEIVAAWKGMDGKQGGDPAKLAKALVQLVALKEPPTRFAAGADAVQVFEAKARRCSPRLAPIPIVHIARVRRRLSTESLPACMCSIMWVIMSISHTEQRNSVENVVVVIGAGQIGQAIARRVGIGNRARLAHPS